MNLYKAYYGLHRSPFEITPDPYFLFPTESHKEALASIYHGLLNHKGFVLLTGEVGTGKTLLVRCLLEALASRGNPFAYVFNTRLGAIEFLQYIAADFEIPTSGTKGELLRALNAYLMEKHRVGQISILVVDEAHQLSPDILEEIRLLTNLETPQQKLLQILLVGQPELDDRLNLPQLRQLKQRIALRARLTPLEETETKGYILNRLALAGANGIGSELFPDTTVSAIHRYSSGIPRLINTICENVLLAAFGRCAASVTPEMIEEIAADFRLGIVA